MKEIWEQAILSYNLPLTILLGVMILYWLLSLVGAVDVDTFDVDFDVDADLDVGTDANGEVHEASGGSWFFGFMRFVNAQDVPLMLILSFLTLFLWTLSIFTNYYFNPSGNDLIALGFLAVNFIISVLLVKIVTQPLRPLMRAIKDDADAPPPVIGSVGVVKSKVLDQQFGQISVIREKGAPALLNCRLRDGEASLVRGSEVLIYDYDKVRERYLVRNLNHTESKDLTNNSNQIPQESSTTATQESPTNQ